MADIARWQIKRIHTVLHAIGMDDAMYRAMLGREPFFATTCKALDYQKAQLLIQRLEYVGEKCGVWSKRRWTAETGHLKYEDLKRRPGMASPRQLRMIEAMWKDVSYQASDAEKERAFNKFLLAHFGISDLRFLEDRQARKIVKTLEAMQQNQHTKGKQNPPLRLRRRPGQSRDPEDQRRCV